MRCQRGKGQVQRGLAPCDRHVTDTPCDRRRLNGMLCSNAMLPLSPASWASTAAAHCILQQGQSRLQQATPASHKSTSWTLAWQAACPAQCALPMPAISQGRAPLHAPYATTPALSRGCPQQRVPPCQNPLVLPADEELSESGGDALPSVQALFPSEEAEVPQEVQHQVGRLAQPRSTCAK